MGHRTSKGPFSIANYGSLLECSAPLANKLRKMERQIWQRRLNSKRIKHLPGFLQHLFTNQSWTFRFFFWELCISHKHQPFLAIRIWAIGKSWRVCIWAKIINWIRVFFFKNSFLTYAMHVRCRHDIYCSKWSFCICDLLYNCTGIDIKKTSHMINTHLYTSSWIFFLSKGYQFFRSNTPPFPVSDLSQWFVRRTDLEDHPI